MRTPKSADFPGYSADSNPGIAQRRRDEMDRTGKISRKMPSPETSVVAGAIYGRSMEGRNRSGYDGTGHSEHIAAILEGLASAFGRSVEVRFGGDKVIISDNGTELSRLDPDRVFSMVEEIRLILSPILDRKI